MFILARKDEKYMSLNKKLENIVWHINTNREVLGDTRTLEDVLTALKRIVEKSEE